MSSQPFSIPIAGTADASGVAVVNLREFLSQWDFQVWSVALVCAGTAPLLQVRVNGTPYLSGAGSNPTVGPVYTHPGDVPSLVLTGLTPSSAFSGLLQGSAASSFDELDPLSAPSSNNVTIAGGSVTLAGPATITGPVTVQQSTPGSLLSGAIGNPLVENASVAIAANSDTVLGGAGGFDLGGFAGVLFTGAPNIVGANAVHCQFEWLDSLGNTVGIAQALHNCVDPWMVVYGTLGRFLRVHFWNVTGSAKSVRLVTLTPLLHLPPSHADLLYTLPGIPSSSVAPPARLLCGGGGAIAVPASSASVLDGNTIISGPAMWTVSNDAGITANAWWAELRGVDAAGIQWSLARAGNEAMNEPIHVTLPPMHYQISIHNTAASAVNLLGVLYAE